MAIKHLFFDLDHTLWDFERNAEECIQEIFEEKADKIPSEVSFEEFYAAFSFLNQAMWAQLDAKEITHEYLRTHRFKNSFEKIGVEINLDLSQEFDAHFLEKLPTKGHVMEGALPLLESLKGNYALHMITNGYLEIQTRKMENAGILHFFEHIVTYDVANSRKPEKAMYEHALNLANCTPDESLMIGDSYVADIQGAVNAGLKAIHFDQTGMSNASYMIARLADLPKMIRDLA
jgi:YjjG family noncanonical pyrimidine nucleotidase